LPLLSGLGIHAMDQQRRMRVVDQRQVGEDLRLLLRP
jgi:diaminohydroxyphosphoribosylaminopyrimidine deaminase/5-amino-6-(5-phosphoribosylamino)uracil reductase